MSLPLADEIKLEPDVLQQNFVGRAGAFEQGKRLAVEFFQMVLQHREVKLFLALEIVIEERLVDPGLGGNDVGPRPGESRSGKFALGGRENGDARFGALGAAVS